MLKLNRSCPLMTFCLLAMAMTTAALIALASAATQASAATIECEVNDPTHPQRHLPHFVIHHSADRASVTNLSAPPSDIPHVFHPISNRWNLESITDNSETSGTYTYVLRAREDYETYYGGSMFSGETCTEHLEETALRVDVNLKDPSHSIFSANQNSLQVEGCFGPILSWAATKYTSSDHMSGLLRCTIQ